MKIDYDCVNSPYCPLARPGPVTNKGSLSYKIQRNSLLNNKMQEMHIKTKTLQDFEEYDRDIAKRFNCKTAKALKRKHRYFYGVNFEDLALNLKFRSQLLRKRKIFKVKFRILDCFCVIIF